MKKESLSIITIKTLLAVIIFTGVGMIIIGGGLLIGKYYKNQDNRFIKPVVREITITTDKIEYEQGETLEITVKNSLNKHVLFRGLGCPCVNSFSIGVKGEDYKEFYNTGTAWCITDIIELKPNTEQVFHLETDSIDDILLVSNISTIYPETYKLKVDYEFNSENLMDEIIYSNEFTIKEKSALDLRCSEKVKFDSFCPHAIIVNGYEFDLDIEKCKEINTSDCSFETPFESLEECQRVCEKKE